MLLILILSGQNLTNCATTRINVRVPPALNPHPNAPSSYIPLPDGWRYGHWFVTHSSQPVYQSFQNAEEIWAPVFPQSGTKPGQINDLSSFQLPNSSDIVTLFGIDTPSLSNDPTLGQGWVDSVDFVATGELSAMNNSYQVVAWGYDTDGVGYLAVYETAILDPAEAQPADVDFFSRVGSGPSAKTLNLVKNALIALGNDVLSDLVKQVIPMVQNGARDGLPPVVCDQTCINNSGFP